MDSAGPDASGTRQDAAPDDAAPEARWSRAQTDNAPARSVWGYVRVMSGWHQLALAALALTAAGLNLAPIELQRRLIDDAIMTGDVDLLWRLALIFAAALVAHKAAKFALQIYQGWVTERTAAYTRRHVLYLDRHRAKGVEAEAGQAVTVVNSEIDKLSGFVGAAPSEAFRDGATLIGVLGYMFWTAPVIAAVALLLLSPQIVIAPLIQRRLNRLVEKRLTLLRELGDAIPGESGADPATLVIRVLRNRLRFTRLKAAMKAALNLLNGAAPLGVLVVGGLMVIEGEVSVGVVVAFVSALERISAPLRGLLAFYRQSAQASVQHDMVAKWVRSRQSEG
jgi:ABC-type bacteriocin/lantibiotic exporter with double-glycine peptidase domain